MSRPFQYTAALLLCSMLPQAGLTEDIDIFVGGGGSSGGRANVLVILDNTANWSANNQKFPGMFQGQAEVLALKNVVNDLADNVHVGLMMLTTESQNQGGMVVFGIRPMTDANLSAWNTRLDALYNNITDSKWKASSNATYGGVLLDAFKYFGGHTSPANATTDVAGQPTGQTGFGTQRYSNIPSNIPLDWTAYTADKSRYVPPDLSDCDKNYIIFIGNGFPKDDNVTFLTNVGGDTSTITPNPMDKGNSKYLADEWARFLFRTDVSPLPGQQNVITYTIDVYKDQPSAQQNQYLKNMARVGGGKYFTATSYTEVSSALQQVFSEIQGVNDTFASASLPVNATNRAQNENQVFIGMFRPDTKANPRWMGNMKRYQLINTGAIELGDADGNPAVNPLTGFITSCARSYWTTDTGSYWEGVTVTPAGTCPAGATPFGIYSDAPDGPIVEKGSVAEVIRKGNNPPTTDTSPTWAVNRTIYTLSGSTLAAFTTATSGLSTAVVDYTLGKDTSDENSNGNLTETRPSIHGDVIHSRPLPINYGGTTGVTVYYGANDATLRAVDASTGKERWAFIAPEFFPRLARLANNSPQVKFPNMSDAIIPTPTRKDYFFDGSIGLYQNADDSEVWIFPVMRRGGRMVYAFDVTNPAAPAFKWKIGCPNPNNDTGCTAGMSGIGQTWSTPAAALVKGYSSATPVVVFGGGYDACEDANTATPACGSTKGNRVYVVNANDGSLIKSFDTLRAVASDVSFIDADNDGMPDYAYVADTGGNLYRIDFVDFDPEDDEGPYVPVGSGSWSIQRIAYTSGAGRKFLFGPGLLMAGGGKVFIAIGSGDRERPLQADYPYANVTNRFYVYTDDLGQSNLTDLDDEGAMTNRTTNPDCDTPATLPTGAIKGWFMDLTENGPGEQVVTSALIAGGMVTFSTNRPTPSDGLTCSVNLGEARGYWVNLLNGSGAVGVPGACGGDRSSAYIGGGLPPSPVLGTVPIDGKPTTVVIGAPQRDGTPSSPISPQAVKPPVDAKRRTVYWMTTGDN